MAPGALGRPQKRPEGIRSARKHVEAPFEAPNGAREVLVLQSPGRAGLGQVGSELARLGPVVYSGADVLPVVYQWFTSGLLQWFTRVLIVFGGALLIF